jgi:putative autoinducer-2 (AI-2) aldolase
MLSTILVFFSTGITGGLPMVKLSAQDSTNSPAKQSDARQVDAGYDAGIPVLGVTAVGKELTRDARYLGLATRIIAELGAQLVKTYYCDEGFEDVVAGCPVPVIMAGGKKLPERDALTMASNAVRAGAAGVDMGRNIFQSAAPAAMMRAVRAVVHDDVDPADAYELFREASAEKVLG